MVIDMEKAEKKTSILSVRIDRYMEGDCEGSISSPHFTQPVRFKGFGQFILIAEQLFDQLNFPQAFFESRHFSKLDEVGQALSVTPLTSVPAYRDFLEGCGRGRQGTFFVNVRMRQHATWQGEITWVERSETLMFRSVMELLKMMEGAISQPAKEPKRKTAGKICEFSGAKLQH